MSESNRETGRPLSPEEDKIRRAWENTPWESLRGSQQMWMNHSVVLVRAAMDDVAKALATDGVRWERDVLGREVELGKRAAIVFRLRGHTSTVVVPANFPWQEWPLPDTDWRKDLSARLQTSVIACWMSKTSGVLVYVVYHAGEDRESYAYGLDEGDGFSSTICKTPAYDLKDPLEFVDHRFRELDTLDPKIGFEYFFRTDPRFGAEREWKPGAKRRVQSLGLPLAVGSGIALTMPPFERVDLLTLPATQ